MLWCQVQCHELCGGHSLRRRRRCPGATHAKGTARMRSTRRSCRAAWTWPGSRFGATPRCSTLGDHNCLTFSTSHLRDTHISCLSDAASIVTRRSGNAALTVGARRPAWAIFVLRRRPTCAVWPQNWTPEARRQVLRARHGFQLPAPRKEVVLLETALFAATQASMPCQRSARPSCLQRRMHWQVHLDAPTEGSPICFSPCQPMTAVRKHAWQCCASCAVQRSLSVYKSWRESKSKRHCSWKQDCVSALELRVTG